MNERLIFLTNDDGFDSRGMEALIDIARRFGRVVVVAPERPQSGMSHAFTMLSPLFIRKVREEEGLEVYALSGTPVACVKVAFDYLLRERKVDLVLSGINHGSNSAVALLYSGTMGAAIEGSFYDCPSIGLSLTDHRPAADFTAVVDPAKRQAAANNHTATHLLDAALRKVLGTHVEQKGSFVTPAYLRFDFSHFRKVTPAELREVERLVNREIRANHPLVERRDATLAEAQAEGAIMLFGEKDGDRVRMVRFGDSVELCGGTHTCATGTIGFFKIVSESAVSAGVRRIEAVTGEGAEKVLYAAEDTLQNVAEFLNNTQVVQAIKKIVESNDALSKEVEAMRQEQVREWADRLVKSLPEQNGVILMAKQSERMPAFIKDLAYNLRARVHNLVMVVGTCQEAKPSLTIMLGDDVVAKGVNAGKVIREAAREMNGGGGGQPFFATAGGKNPDKLQAAIDKAVELIMDELK